MLGAALLAVAAFIASSQFKTPPGERVEKERGAQVVISAPIQTFMYAGDQFLAANLETMRLATIGPEDNPARVRYRVRAHKLISTLNPCHEDNYYLANAMLSWGGSVKQGNEILQRATMCRFWDEFPPFFLGFNRYFFAKDLDGAEEAIRTAARRSVKNRSSFEQMVIGIEARKLNDEKMALSYLRSQRDQAEDKTLAQLLDRRLKRLEGLLTLRKAQERFEKKYGRQLKQPGELLSSGILQAFPQDPMKIGYEFINGEFRLKALNIGGIEVR